MERSLEEVRAILQRFQDGYTARDVSQLDEFMTLFAPDEDIGLYRDWGRQARRE